jgi:hypothetical protein|tara:strand:+ start:510 stop:734 length:225 start_codon:yes stop_codon:yes gene_type:complete
MDDQKPLSDQFPVIEGKVMGLNCEDNMNQNLLKYKLWMALNKLSELTTDTSVDDGADFAYDIENEIFLLEQELK